MLSFLRNLSGKEVTHGVDEQFLVKPSLWEWFSLGGLESWNRTGLIVSLWEILSPSQCSVSSPVFTHKHLGINWKITSRYMFSGFDLAFVCSEKSEKITLRKRPGGQQRNIQIFFCLTCKYINSLRALSPVLKLSSFIIQSEWCLKLSFR